MYTQILNHFRQKNIVSESTKALFEQYFVHLHIPKNTIIEEEGKTPEHLYFINDGYIRSFYYDDQGDEVTTYLAGPRQYMALFLSLIQQLNATENIETITDCSLLKIKRIDFLKIIDGESSFKEYSLGIFEQAFSKMNKRANDLATLTAEQRYLQLIDNEGDIILNIPIQYIASYLGIKPQSLSRIRKQIIK